MMRRRSAFVALALSVVAAAIGLSSPVLALTQTTTTLVPDSPTVYSNGILYFTLTVTPTPSLPALAWLELHDQYGATLLTSQSASVSPVDGTARPWLSMYNVPGGAYSVIGHYQGTSTDAPSDSSPVPITVLRAPTTTQLYTALHSSILLPGDSFNLDARLSATSGDPVSFYETINGTDEFLGTAPIVYFGVQPSGPVYDAELSITAVEGTHHYVAVYPGTTTLDESRGTLDLTITRGTTVTSVSAPASLQMHHSMTITATVLPDVGAGTLTVRDDTTNTLLGTFDGTYASLTVPASTIGTHVYRATYSGTAQYLPSSGTRSVSIVADTAQAAGVGVAYATFYPIVDGYLDTDSIRGTRLEPLAVSINIYNSANTRVRSVGFSRGSGTYAFAWNGRSTTGVLLPAGSYQVVQVLTDAYGSRLVVRSAVSISWKRLYTYSTTLTRLASPYTAKGTQYSGTVTSYSDGSVRLAGTCPTALTCGWAAVGWQFGLPSATVYKALTLGVYGYTAVPPASFGAQNFKVCPYSTSTTWNIGCFDHFKSVSTSTAWTYVGLSVSDNDYGKVVRGAVQVRGTFTRIYQVRLIVSYAILR